MIQATDVSAVLATKSKLVHPLYIRRDLDKNIRLRNATKRKRKLIESGTHKFDITVKNNSILIKGVVYGKLDLQT